MVAKRQVKRQRKKTPGMRRDVNDERARKIVEEALASGQCMIAVAYVDGDVLKVKSELFNFPDDDLQTFANFIVKDGQEEGSVAGGDE